MGWWKKTVSSVEHKVQQGVKITKDTATLGLTNRSISPVLVGAVVPLTFPVLSGGIPLVAQPGQLGFKSEQAASTFDTSQRVARIATGTAAIVGGGYVLGGMAAGAGGAVAEAGVAVPAASAITPVTGIGTTGAMRLLGEAIEQVGGNVGIPGTGGGRSGGSLGESASGARGVSVWVWGIGAAAVIGVMIFFLARR